MQTQGKASRAEQTWLGIEEKRMGASGLEATAQGGGGRQAGRRSAPGQSRSAQGGVRTAGLGPAAGGRILAGSARVGELGGEGDAYIGMVESFWLARQEKKWAGLLVWAEKIFFYFLFLQKDSTNLI